MSKLSRTAALDNISKWNTKEVIEILKKNGLEECCHAVLKRQIDGDELLHLTEGKLALWKSDLSRPQTWSLWTFVEELRRAPEEHVTSQNIVPTEQEPVSDSGSWGTDFEDEEDDDDTPVTRKANVLKNNIPQRSRDFRNSLLMFQRNEKLEKDRSIPAKPNDSSPESLYMNYGWETDGDAENNYMNLEPEAAPSQKCVSQLHNKFEKSLAEQLREQLKLLESPESKPVKTMKKPEVITEKPARPVIKPLPTSFLHNNSLPNLRADENKDIKKPAIPPPRPVKPSRAVIEKYDELPKPPVMLRNFDLVRDLPVKTDESDDEYEPFDEHIIEQNRIHMGSKQSLIQGSVESVYKPSSTTSQENNDCEIYEVITENPDENGYYIEPIAHSNIKNIPPPLPSTPNISEPIGTSTSTMSKIHKKRERSPDKKSATLPHAYNVVSLSPEMRATRPLPPPPPFGEPYMEASWFHNITREQAIALIKERACSSSHNGYFLLRPSTSDLNSPLVLVLWFKDRVYNVPVRKRPDGRYALGSLKTNEQTFPSVEDIIKYHLREELLLYSTGVPMGSTKLTDSPPK
ncbi:hypothetical protein PV328_003489 [Microctonus aethiopoides]|uniref:SH2 domain-containing protein n=1 Tax=Microctonus aethiopoides TaxID=144406 RepID=A0AA39F8N2_9HYME|nr:hypothetical protein PV328_003489 [Microctonus aethiopoides]